MHDDGKNEDCSGAALVMVVVLMVMMVVGVLVMWVKEMGRTRMEGDGRSSDGGV